LLSLGAPYLHYFAPKTLSIAQPGKKEALGYFNSTLDIAEQCSAFQNNLIFLHCRIYAEQCLPHDRQN
jgi:hypothetical protein